MLTSIRQWFTPKRTAILLGFLSSIVGTLGSFVFIERLNREIRGLSGRKTAALQEIQRLENAASEYFLSSQQGDLVFALSLQDNARKDLVKLLYQGNLLDRATPIRNVIGSLAMSKVMNYQKTYGEYQALVEAAQTDHSLERFFQVKEFERRMVEQATLRGSQLYELITTLNDRIDQANRNLATRQRVALAFSVLGAVLLLYANLAVEKSFARTALQPPSVRGTGAEPGNSGAGGRGVA